MDNDDNTTKPASSIDSVKNRTVMASKKGKKSY